MSSEGYVVQPLHPSQVKSAAVVLARAFQSDPAFLYVVPQAERRESALVWLFARLVSATLEAGLVLSTNPLSGVALWLGPERHELPVITLLKNGMALLPLVLGWSCFRRFLALGRCTQRLHRTTLRSPHLSLFALGVDPERQRQGVGSALLAPVLAEADAKCLPCYLDTANPANLAYYARFGFDLASKSRVSKGEPLALWAMVRMPKRSER